MFIEIFIDYKKINAAAVTAGFSVSLVDGCYVVGNKKSGLEVKLKQRSAYPTTYCQKIDDQNIVLGYGGLDPKEGEEFLQIAVSSNGDLIIKRDEFVTLPLFYSFTKTVFSASNNFCTVVSNTPQLTVSKLHVLETLIPNTDRHTTLWEQINILNERHTLEINNRRLALGIPEPRSWAVTKDAPPQNPHHFNQILKHFLDEFINTRLTGQQFGFEVSGGIDSSLLPLYFSKNNSNKNLSVGYMKFPDSFGQSQQHKLDQLELFTGFGVASTAVGYEDDYPLARIIKNKKEGCFYTFEEIYSEALDKLAHKFQQEGVKVIATGIAGDELFENVISADTELQYGIAEQKRRRQMMLPPFLTESFRRDYVDVTPAQVPYPLPLLAISVIGAGISRNNIYINRDIWPVSPFAQPGLYDFCQGLPAHFRANKNVLRAFCQVNNYPEVIYNPSQNEHFGIFFDKSLKSSKYKQVIGYHSKNSKLASMGYVDINKLKETYELSKNGNGEYDKWLFNIFTWLTIELNLASHRDS
jgi:hypothetical protein